jgi:glycosyltransferase involved in cell wall biosynthesis
MKERLMLGNYVIISPVRNEVKYLTRTIRSVVQQQCRPQAWVIVDDGSTDQTFELAQEAASRFAWIKAVRRTDRGFREPGCGVIEAFYDGLTQLPNQDYEFVCKMDGDLEFAPDYFSTLLQEFEQKPRLGLASGVTYLQKPSGKLVQEKVAPNFAVGPIKLYRRACFEAIGGLVPHLGWDTIDVYRARLLGWETANYPELKVIHLRQMGTARGIVWGKIKTGMGEYYYGSHPLFVIARCLYRMTERPFILNGLSIGIGYVQAWLRREPRLDDPAFVSFLRADQLSRLRKIITPWRKSSSGQLIRMGSALLP